MYTHTYLYWIYFPHISIFVSQTNHRRSPGIARTPGPFKLFTSFSSSWKVSAISTLGRQLRLGSLHGKNRDATIGWCERRWVERVPWPWGEEVNRMDWWTTKNSSEPLVWLIFSIFPLVDIGMLVELFKPMTSDDWSEKFLENLALAELITHRFI